MNVNEKIKALRKLMKEKAIDAYIVPTSDPHQSEYLADYYQTRVWLTGFTGSAGTAVVTEDKAILWTDGRYFIQAAKELEGSEFELYKIGIPGYPTYSEWLAENLDDKSTIGFDGKNFPQAGLDTLKAAMGRKEINFNIEDDLIDPIWEDRLEEPKTDAFVHELKYTGYSAKEKIEQVREQLKKKSASHTVIGSLDDIAWLYNIRGRDVSCNPVVISYAIVSLDEAYLFVNEEKLDQEVRNHLTQNGIKIEDYSRVRNFLEGISKESVVYLNPNFVNAWLYAGIPSDCHIVKGLNITTELKAIKNETEIKNQKNAYIRDGVALVKFFHWLDETVGREKVTEVSAADKLEDFRREGELFVEPSFNTIAGYKANAAMMHYRATEEGSNDELKEEGMLLVDSGGQYFDGTTDITRTIILGPISEEEKKDFTLTFKSHTMLLDSKFLYGSTGERLDAICRYPMWQEGLDYKCGTGHGVGYFLNVHEGPHSISPRPNTTVLEEGMIVTIEPGVYKAGLHGVRIENDVVVRKAFETEHGGQFMEFEVISFAPIDLRGIEVSMLNEKEKKWLNNYHKAVYEKLAPHLDNERKAWLKNATREI